jgi:DNA-binding NarL/FixJ family response regulator
VSTALRPRQSLIDAHDDLADIPLTTRLNAALLMCGHAEDADGARVVLEALGLVAERPRLRVVPAGQPTTRGGRAAATESRRTFIEARDQRILALLEEGLTQAEVSTRLGLNLSAVRAARRRAH